MSNCEFNLPLWSFKLMVRSPFEIYQFIDTITTFDVQRLIRMRNKNNYSAILPNMNVNQYVLINILIALAASLTHYTQSKAICSRYSAIYVDKINYRYNSIGNIIAFGRYSTMSVLFSSRKCNDHGIILETHLVVYSAVGQHSR